MAVTVETYRRAGGIPPLPSLEDVALHDALRRIDARIRHSPAVRVVTSARPRGRTEFGFAVQLQRWSSMGRRGEPFLVESPPSIFARIAASREARGTSTALRREAWRQDAVSSLDNWPLVPIEVAIGELRLCLAHLRTARSSSVRALEQVQPVGFPTAAG
jgi:hypothetical protein